MEALKPNSKRAQNAITLVWIVMAFDIASLISNYLQYNLLTDARNGVSIGESAAEANDWRERIIAVLSLIAMIVSAVTFIQWFRRAYFNLHQKVSDLRHEESQAAICWFIPFVNLGRPYQIMKELYEETQQVISAQNGGEQIFSQRLLGAWWTLWIVNAIVGQAVSRIALKAESIDEMINGTAASMVMHIVGIPLAIVTVRVIKDYAKVEPLLAGSVASEDGGALDSAPISNN